MNLRWRRRKAMENLWLYEILCEAWGVVKAENKEETEQKIREAYKSMIHHLMNIHQYL